MLFGLEPKTWLGLSALGAIVSTIGALFGIVLKEYFFSRSLERWKHRQTLEQVYRRFRDPLVLSAREIASRTLEILEHYPPVYLRSEVLASRPVRQIENSIDDAYFQRYKLISTAYRLSAFLGWLELYRQEITFLHSGDSKHAKSLELAVGEIRGDLADGQLITADDWQTWRDVLVFREELRAIGESMIESRSSQRTVISYGRYTEQLESASPNAVQRWAAVVFNFYLDLESGGKDFREVRLKRMLVHLVELIQLLEPSFTDSRLLQAAARLRADIPD